MHAAPQLTSQGSGRNVLQRAGTDLKPVTSGQFGPKLVSQPSMPTVSSTGSTAAKLQPQSSLPQQNSVKTSQSPLKSQQSTAATKLARSGPQADAQAIVPSTQKQPAGDNNAQAGGIKEDEKVKEARATTDEQVQARKRVAIAAENVQDIKVNIPIIPKNSATIALLGETST